MSKSMFFILMFALFLLPARASDAQGFVPPGGENFASAPVQKGLPEIEPGRPLPLKVSDPSYAWINPKGDFAYVYFFKFTDKKKDIIYSIVYSSGTGFSLTRMAENGQEEGRMNFTATILDEAGKNNLIKVIYVPKDESIYYSWISPGGGGITIVPVISPGKNFPSLSINTNDQKTFSFGKFKGRIVVINWWATSCAPCAEEIPGLNSLVDKYDSSGVVFVAVAYDPDNLNGFLAKRDFKYIQGLASPDMIKTLGGAFPRNIIIDRSGKVVYDHTGGSADQYKKIEEVLSGLVLKKK